MNIGLFMYWIGSGLDCKSVQKLSVRTRFRLSYGEELRYACCWKKLHFVNLLNFIWTWTLQFLIFFGLGLSFKNSGLDGKIRQSFHLWRSPHTKFTTTEVSNIQKSLRRSLGLGCSTQWRMTTDWLQQTDCCFARHPLMTSLPEVKSNDARLCFRQRLRPSLPVLSLASRAPVPGDRWRVVLVTHTGEWWLVTCVQTDFPTNQRAPPHVTFHQHNPVTKQPAFRNDVTAIQVFPRHKWKKQRIDHKSW